LNWRTRKRIETWQAVNAVSLYKSLSRETPELVVKNLKVFHSEEQATCQTYMQSQGP
jgi:hypothetical protein